MTSLSRGVHLSKSEMEMGTDLKYEVSNCKRDVELNVGVQQGLDKSFERRFVPETTYSRRKIANKENVTPEHVVG